MPSQSKSSKIVKQAAAKPRAVAKKAPAKSKIAAKPAARKSSAKRVPPKKPATLLQTVKQTVQTGIDKVGAAVKSITPDALLPNSARSKRR